MYIYVLCGHKHINIKNRIIIDTVFCLHLFICNGVAAGRLFEVIGTK